MTDSAVIPRPQHVLRSKPIAKQYIRAKLYLGYLEEPYLENVDLSKLSTV